MPEKDHIEGLVKLLEKLKDPTWAKTHEKMASQYVGEVVSKQATSRNGLQQENARKISQRRAKEDKGYNNRPVVAKNSLEATLAAVRIVAGDLPDFLPNDPKAILTTSIARLTERFAQASPELRKNPNFVLSEIYTAYWATDWNSLAKNTSREVWETINKGYDYALHLAAQKPEYNHITLEFGPDRNRFKRSIDDRPDFFRTEKNATGKLGKVLQRQQKVFDGYGEMSLEKKKEFLEDFKAELAEGVADKKFTSKSIESFRQIMDARLKELEQQLPPEQRVERTESRSGGVFEENVELEEEFGATQQAIPELTQAEKEKFIQSIESPAFKAMAKNILDNFQNLNMDERWKILQQLKDPTGIFSQISVDAEARLMAGNPSRAVTAEERINATIGDLDRLRGFQSYLWEQMKLSSKDMPSYTYWGTPEGRENLKRMKIEIADFGENEENIAAFRVWDEIQDKLLFVSNKSQFFQQAGWTFYREQDLEGFYTILRRRLNFFKESGAEFKRPDGTVYKMDDDKIQRILTRFYHYRDLKEMFHNFRVILEHGDFKAKETLSNYAQSFMDQDGDYLKKNIRGLEFAMHLQEGGMDWIATLNDGRLPNEAMAEVNGVSQWKDHYKDQFRRWVAGVQGKTEPWLAQFQGMTDLEIDRALEMSFGFNIVNMNTSMWLTRVKGARGYRARYGDPLTFDGIRSPYLKFSTEKQALPILYQVLTGDLDGAEKIRNQGWSVDDIIEQIYFKEGDPEFEERMAGYRNIADITSRQGYGSNWGPVAMREVWHRELFKHRGVGARLQDAESRIMDDYEKEIRGNVTNRDPKIKERKGELEERVAEALEKKSADIQKEVTKEIGVILEEALDIMPGTIAQRMVDDHAAFHSLKDIKKPSERNWALMEELWGEEEVARVLGGYTLTLESSNFPGGTITLDVRESFRRRAAGERSHSIFGQLWKAMPKNNDGIIDNQQLLIKKQHTKAETAWLGFVERNRRLTGDLELVQQAAVTRIINQAKVGRDVTARIEYGNIHQGDWGDWDIISGDNALKRRREAMQYARKIKAVALGYEIDTQGNFRLDQQGQRIRINEERDGNGRSFIDRLSRRIVRRQERFLLSTIDAPWGEFEYNRPGGRGFSRGLDDANSMFKGLMGLTPVMKHITAEVKQEDLAKILKENVYDNMARYWDVAAQAFCAPIVENISKHFGENRIYSYGFGLFAPIGDLLATDAVQKWLRQNKLYRAMASQAKVFISHHAQAWGPNEEHKWIEINDGLNTLPKGRLVYPISWGLMGTHYTADDIEKRRKATPIHAMYEYLSYIPMGGIIIMILEGIREGTKEEK